MGKLQAAGYGRYVVGHKFPSPALPEVQESYSSPFKIFALCLYSVCVFAEPVHWTFFMDSEGFYIGMDLKGHFSSACHIGQEHHGNVPDACSPAFQPLEAKIHASEAHSAPHEPYL